jgi:hypothetical protein
MCGCIYRVRCEGVKMRGEGGGVESARMGACMGRRKTSEVMFELGGDSWSLIRVPFRISFLFIYSIFINICICGCWDIKKKFWRERGGRLC